MSHVVTNLAIALIALNFLTFAAFGIDKAKAERGKRRTAERTPLLLAFLGGTPGAYAGRAAFRHKTRKESFSRELHTIAALQVVAIGLGLGWVLGGLAPPPRRPCAGRGPSRPTRINATAAMKGEAGMGPCLRRGDG